jgi:2',3'-cyclic-nucleotide 2'-phosphodiesterase (5'-nucleotidase family)
MRSSKSRVPKGLRRKFRLSSCTPQPIVHPDTRTILTQTYGYGTRLGRVRLKVRDRKVVAHDAKLLKVWSDELEPHPAVAARVGHYRELIAPQIGPPLGRCRTRLIRKYNTESPLGSLIADVMRQRMHSDVALTNAGGLRADLPEGPIDRGHILDAFPFLNDTVTVALAGGDLRSVIEQGLSLRAGMAQVSGMRAEYDLTRPIGERIVKLEVGGKPFDNDRVYQVTSNSFLTEGGDGYGAFKRGQVVARDKQLSEILNDYVESVGVVESPEMGRLVPVQTGA